MISEQKKKEIENEAREILSKFSKALQKVRLKEASLKEKAGGFREEGSGNSGDKDFRERMFENAPEKEGDCIIAEKKKW